MGLGIVHVAIPRIVGYRVALGTDAGDLPILGAIGIGRRTYGVRRADLLGLTWVMSNAASYVLITIGLIDLSWAAGWRGVPIAIGAAWIAGWWAIRAVSQLALGHRRGDVLVASWFGALGVLHVAIAIALG